MQNQLFNVIQYCKPYPFIQWVGGKRYLASKILPIIKELKPKTYIEPFIGGGAIFWEIASLDSPPSFLVINDKCKPLITCYQVVRNNPYDLIDALLAIKAEYSPLKSHDERRAYYNQKRAIFNTKPLSEAEASATLIFLVRAGFKGLYRENRQGKFNGTYGFDDRFTHLNHDNILACHRVLKNVEILNTDFSNIPTMKSFYYFDPPYEPVTCDYHEYLADGFNHQDQLRLRAYCDRINTAGGKFMLSNSYCQRVYLTWQGYNVTKTLAPQQLGNRKGEGYQLTPEVLVTNF